MSKSGFLINNNIALPFLLAGKSEVTIKSGVTGNKYTYFIKRRQSLKDEEEYVYFINVHLNGNSTYAGIMFFDSDKDRFIFKRGKNGNFSENDIPIKALMYVINKLYNGEYGIDVEIYHCGICGRCGKKLTTPESILTGLGPNCAKAVGVPHPKNKTHKK